jgi:mannose-1-phosphate guanylyltransferase
MPKSVEIRVVTAIPARREARRWHSQAAMSGRYRTSLRAPDLDGHDWTIALAGGEGTRLSEYIRRRFGQTMPKQYCRLLGRRSMLEHTLDRLALLTPTARTLTVVGVNHDAYAMPQLETRTGQVFRQPAARDTGVALYVALAMIRKWDPNAILTITPTDHFVAPATRYLEQVRAARGVARRMVDTVVMVGVHPSQPDPDFGYIAVGDRAAHIPSVHAVRAFVEKPPAAQAAALVDAGALWNTMVTCATLVALWELARITQPRMFALIEALVPTIGTDYEDDAIAAVYRDLPPISFSRDMLEHAPERLAITALEDVEWSDWGRPERVEEILARRARHHA